MRKKVILITISMFLVIGLLVACGNAESTTNGKEDGYGMVPVYTPPAGGINYIISAGIGDILNRTKPLGTTIFSVEATPGGSDIVMNLMERYELGQSAIGAFAYETAHSLYHGESDILPGEYPELRVIGYMADTALHMVVKEGSPIKSFADLKGKRVGTAVPGDTMFYFIRDLLEEQYGLNEKDYQGIPLSYSEVQDGIRNGSIEAGLIMGMPPAPSVLELAQTDDIRVLSVDPDKMEKFIEDKPYYSSIALEPGTYPGQDEEVLIGSFSSIFVTHAKTDNKVVYEFLRTIFDHNKDLKAVHPTFNVTEENITEGIELPYHPGAIEFFEDHGIEYKK